jgi:hypothetical protein
MSAARPRPDPTAVSTWTPKSANAFNAAGVSFVDASHGWAVGSSRCSSGRAVCLALLATTDGRHWSPIRTLASSPIGAPLSRCRQRCVDSIAFLTRSVGYIYGRSALYVTKDGGQRWRLLSGGAFSILASDGIAIRVLAPQPLDCLPGCQYRLERATAAAPTVWRDSPLPVPPEIFSFDLVGLGRYAYAIFYGHGAGGASNARAELFVSADNGRTWTIRDYGPLGSGEVGSRDGEPCPQGHGYGKVDSDAIAVGFPGTVTVGCLQRTTAATPITFTVVSTDHGNTFVRQGSPKPSRPGADQHVADLTQHFLPSGVGWQIRLDGGYRYTTNGGHTWDNRTFG